MIRLHPIERRFWRMVRVPFQRDPLSGEGARLYGGRWNARGIAALYCGASHDEAIAEYYQGLPKPGTLIAYDVVSKAVADLTDGRGRPCDARVAEACACAWATDAALEKTPASWAIASELIEAGADGALVPSVAHPGGTNLVLWRWHEARQAETGAAVIIFDPLGDLAH